MCQVGIVMMTMSSQFFISKMLHNNSCAFTGPNQSPLIREKDIRRQNVPVLNARTLRNTNRIHFFNFVSNCVKFDAINSKISC